MEKQIQYFDSFKINNFKGGNILILVNEVEGTETPIELGIVIHETADDNMGKIRVIIRPKLGSEFQYRNNFDTKDLADNFVEAIMKANVDCDYANHGLTRNS